VLVLLSPVVSGAPTSIVHNVDFHLFPLSNPGIVSIPVSFLCGYLGTVLNRRDRADPARAAEMEVRSLTGIGS
jgi:cation/acetate symporter